MSSIEHYFENLIFHGKDCNDDSNKKQLSKEVSDTIETCYYYLAYSLFPNEYELRRVAKALVYDYISIESSKDLASTITYMLSEDWEDRLIAEYYQAKIRLEKLKTFIDENYGLRTNALCDQYKYLEKYLDALRERIEEEKIVNG